MNVIKRNGVKVPFNKDKIEIAITAAMKNGSGIYLPDIAKTIASDIEQTFTDLCLTEVAISTIEDLVFKKLVLANQVVTAKMYESYRAVRQFQRESNTTDESVKSLVDKTNETLLNENSNKDSVQNSTQRDLIAGIISKDIVMRTVLPGHLAQAHQTGAIHIHDMDYMLQPMTNCCLINLGDMLDNGTVINKKQIKAPKSFQVACTVTTQIIAQVASNQYGGQSIDLRHLAKYVTKSREKYRFLLSEEIRAAKRLLNLSEEDNRIVKAQAEALTRKEIKAGIQTIQYQVNTLEKIGA